MRRFLCLLSLVAGPAAAAPTVAPIKVNGLGFLPGAQKLAVLPAGAGDRFEVVGEDGKRVFAAALSAPVSWAPSAERVRVADFSGLAASGSYRLRVPGLPLSDRFVVAPDAYRSLGAAALKAFYFNRSGIALDVRHAGAYARGRAP
ncbi:cellulase N-terminal Ig-like domain-containing protein [Massilia sp. Dwa41.01b]|uniref:cellulase N-terminal Ig-like domain-containing protein n=1 Tax=Massilia sp. Dwa41.01b TaxID=2709302 RepID=UPI001E4EEB76|nr:cellulase N-terminal Ig-like domain-containing protein [Massilia sp. Dwa41.01b]